MKDVTYFLFLGIDLEKSRLISYLPTIIVPAIFATIKMLVFSAVLSIFFGVILGSIMAVTASHGLKPNKVIYWLISRLTDIIRSFPVLILMVLLMPLTKMIVGTSIGVNAAIVSITIACTPFAARMTESAIQSVDPNLVKAANSFGASNFQILRKVLLVEAFPQLVSNFTILVINILNTTAIAGVLGAGGLGAVALAYGYQTFDDAIMYFIVVILLIFVLLIQGIGGIIYKKIK